MQEGEEEEEEEEEQEKMVVEANEKVSPPVVSHTKVLAPPHQSPLSGEA